MRKKRVPIWQRYPPIPKDASVLDVVDEYIIVKDANGQNRSILIGRVYCPKESTRSDELFDPTTEDALKAAEKYKKAVQNRKRYDKDIKRRRLRED